MSEPPRKIADAARSSKLKEILGSVQSAQLTAAKTSSLEERGEYKVTGFVLCNDKGDRCIVEMSAVRWLDKDSMWKLMHGAEIESIAGFDSYSWLRKRQEKIALGAAAKEVEELSEEEKLAICFVSGAPMTCEPGEEIGMMKISTARKVGIAKINGQFKVFVESDVGHGQKITIPGPSRVEDASSTELFKNSLPHCTRCEYPIRNGKCACD